MKLEGLSPEVRELVELAAEYEGILDRIRRRASENRSFELFAKMVNEGFSATYERRKRLFPSSPNAGADCFLRPPESRSP